MKKNNTKCWSRTNHNNDKKKQQYGDDNGGDILGVPDIYISHNWKNTTFAFLVADFALESDLIHGHNEFDNKTTSNTNIAISTNFREMLENGLGVIKMQMHHLRNLSQVLV